MARFLIIWSFGLILLSCAREPVVPVGPTPIVAFENGRRELLTAQQVRARGLTIVDLSNHWAPYLFSERHPKARAAGPNRAGSLYRQLANGVLVDSPTRIEANRRWGKRRGQGRNRRAKSADRGASYLEVYGILPALTRLRRRAVEELPRPCFEQVRFDRIRRFNDTIPYRGNRAADRYAQEGRRSAALLRERMDQLRTADPKTALSSANPYEEAIFEQALGFEALVEAQAQLGCAGLLSAVRTEGGLDWPTHRALLAFERKNRIFGWGNLAGHTLEALKKKPVTRLYEALSRVLVERIADATGVIEEQWLARSTSVALVQLGIAKPTDAAAFLRDFDSSDFDHLEVGLRLPRRPAHYDESLQLSAVIDPGDVWYDFPYRPDGTRLEQPRERSPRLTLFTEWRGQKIELITMGTTVGGWQSERAPDGYDYLKYKGSSPGDHHWQRIIAGPVWIPPVTTPPGEIIADVPLRGRHVRVIDYDQIGPWYASAYGLAAAVHRQQGEGGEWRDEGIRTHGSHDYTSIAHRHSHGCHRLRNHLALRLFSFVLKHTPHRREGHIEQRARTTVTFENETYTIKFSDRGYHYTLLRPIPVRVKQGRIRGSRRKPIDGYHPKPGAAYGPSATALTGTELPHPEEGQYIL